MDLITENYQNDEDEDSAVYRGEIGAKDQSILGSSMAKEADLSDIGDPPIVSDSFGIISGGNGENDIPPPPIPPTMSAMLVTTKNAGENIECNNLTPDTSAKSVSVRGNATAEPISASVAANLEQSDDDSVFKSASAKSSGSSVSSDSAIIEEIKADIAYKEGLRSKLVQDLLKKTPQFASEIAEERLRIDGQRNKLVGEAIQAILTARQSHQCTEELLISELQPKREAIATEKNILQHLLAIKQPTSGTTAKVAEESRVLMKLESDFEVFVRKMETDKAREQRRYNEEEKAIWNELKVKVLKLEDEFKTFEAEREEVLLVKRKQVGSLQVATAKKRRLLTVGDKVIPKKARENSLDELDAFILEESSPPKENSAA